MTLQARRVSTWIVPTVMLAVFVPASVMRADPVPDEEQREHAAEPAAPASPAWSFSVSAATYIVPDTRVYEQPTVSVDADRLHVEARYNNEALDTGSAWLGCNLGIERALTIGFTPMVGGVFGHTNGVAPGFKLTLGYWKVELFTEAEYLFDTDDHTGNFAYAWSELSLAPTSWLRFGIVSQRTNAYETDVEFQRGLLLGLTYRRVSVTAYVFDLDQSEQPVVVSVGASF